MLLFPKSSRFRAAAVKDVTEGWVSGGPVPIRMDDNLQNSRAGNYSACSTYVVP